MAGPFREGLARVARGGRWGHIRRSGEFAYEPRFDMALEFSEGRAVVKIGKRQGYISPEGDIVVPVAYRYAHAFSEGLAKVNTGTGEAQKVFLGNIERSSHGEVFTGGCIQCGHIVGSVENCFHLGLDIASELQNELAWLGFR